MAEPPLDDRIQMLVPVVRGLSELLGPDCAVWLQDVRRRPCSIIAIENGPLIGRKSGDHPGADALRRPSQDAGEDDVRVHVAARDGRMLKSLLVTLRTQKGEAIGHFGLAFDVSELVQARRAITRMIGPDAGGDQPPRAKMEPGEGDVRDFVDGMINRIVDDMGKTPGSMSREEKMEVVRRLEGQGAFLVKRSAEQVASALDVSRYTVFSYLKEIRRGGSGPA